MSSGFSERISLRLRSCAVKRTLTDSVSTFSTASSSSIGGVGVATAGLGADCWAFTNSFPAITDTVIPIKTNKAKNPLFLYI